MTMLEASQYLILYSSNAFWPESTSQKRSSPAEIITTDICVNRLATRLRGNIGKYVGGECVGAVGGGGSIHWVSFLGLSMCHRVSVQRDLVSLRTGPRFVCCPVSVPAPVVR